MPVRTLRLNDIDELDSLFSRWSGRFEQLSRGKFDARLQVLRGGLVRTFSIEANQRVLLRGSDAAGRVSVFAVTEGNASALWQGRQLSPGHLVVHGIESDADHCSGRHTEAQGFSVLHTQLEEAARVLLAKDMVAIPRSWEVLRPSPEHYTEFRRAVNGLMSECTKDPGLILTTEGTQLQELCLRRLVDSLFAPTTSKLALALPVRARLLQRAEEVMRSRFREPLTAVELCREVGASDRTLRLAFRERYGMGPMAYYACLRLNAVRARLKSGSGLAVSAAAHEFGFQHMGNFGANYRQLFGERPVETRR